MLVTKQSIIPSLTVYYKNESAVRYTSYSMTASVTAIITCNNF